MSCERVTATDPKSEGQFVEGKPVKLAFSTVGDDLFYLAGEPNVTSVATPVTSVPPSSGNETSGNETTTSGNQTTTTTTLPATVTVHLSTEQSSHLIEEIEAGSGNYRIKFNDAHGGYLRVVIPEETETVLLDITTAGVCEILRDFSDFTTFQVEHAASFSWRFRVGTGDKAKYLAWCGQSTCGQGVPALRMMSGMFCGSLTSSGIRCDVTFTN